ncbi:PTS sugar transporter subunit IIA [Aneurinibacillus terranovensis]|uniref:PTS sugar transporter subunit IIA n=1 Tax=Aneurinibacillus terranovensis TaxID=278991 RepID=UPI0003FD6337|nr:PTS sugar transporter subunit IIA [Aneurinibacillus terranovensis]
METIDQDIVINENFVILNMEEKTVEGVLSLMAATLFESGYVKDTFKDALLAREEIYPTGLPASCCGVAIPHTDEHHVINPAICIGTIKNPVSFKMMGSPDVSVNVQLVFVLAIKGASNQLNLLQKLMGIFSDESLLSAFKEATSKQQILEHLQKILSLGTN